MPPKDKYSDPKLRDQVKQEIQDSDKGGAPGQWSARKAQFMAQEYKRRGGGYNTDKSQQDESQKNLSKWTEEEWQTKEGSGHAKQEDGTEKRYLPKKAWENMTEEEKEATDQKKQKESKKGKQFVQNTRKAKQSREKANNEEHEKFEKKKAQEKQQIGGTEDEEMEEDDDDGHEAASADNESEDNYQDDVEAASDEDGDEGEPQDEASDNTEQEDHVEENAGGKQPAAGQKRKKQQANGSSKKQKSNNGGNAPPGKVGSKHMDAEEPAPRGSADRLPKKGQQITWKAMPGYVDGTVEEILTAKKSVNGGCKTVNASKDDPKIVLKSNSSGKICVHKPDACFYE